MTVCGSGFARSLKPWMRSTSSQNGLKSFPKEDSWRSSARVSRATGAASRWRSAVHLIEVREGKAIALTQFTSVHAALKAVGLAG